GRFPGLIGVKTGHTAAAGWSEVAAARGRGLTVYATLLGSPDRSSRNDDLSELLAWGLAQYRVVTVIAADRVYGTVTLPYGRHPRGPPPMLVTVTLNAAIDRTLTVPNFQRGRRHRASAGLTLAGGKGINVARALKALKVPVVATGLVGGATGIRIVEALTSEAILNDFVRIDGESRTSTAVVDPAGGTYTEINEWGPAVSDEELGVLIEKLRYLTQGAELVVFAGSLPRDVAADFYAEAVRELNRRQIAVVLDC